MKQNILKKSCTGVLLSIDLTGHSHPTQIGRKDLDGSALLSQASKGHHFRILIFLPKCSATKYQKIGYLFCAINICGPSNRVVLEYMI